MKNNSQSNQQKFIRQAIACAFILLGIFSGVEGTRDMLSGKPTLDGIQGIAQGIELIHKACRIRKSLEESDRT
ncbi:hypothetical protein [Microseira sp. BLCC-F43]|uniref:hypothetical protein n=1 Tax=Microseira sp. BLCC-F43 TaxID=3153602 RepID=UPI0035B92503